MDIFDPTISAEAQEFSYAPRPQSLQGLRVGLVENTKFNSETILRKVGERLATQYGMSVTHLDHKQSSGHSVTDEAIAELKARADVVLAGVGD